MNSLGKLERPGMSSTRYVGVGGADAVGMVSGIMLGSVVMISTNCSTARRVWPRLNARDSEARDLTVAGGALRVLAAPRDLLIVGSWVRCRLGAPRDLEA